MLCVEDALDALAWAQESGGLEGLIARSRANLGVIEDWVARSVWADFLAESKAIRSSTSVCLKIVDPWFQGLDEDAQAKAAKDIVACLEGEAAAHDIGGYRDAPPGLRVWAGATVETDDLRKLMPWLDWAFAEVKGAA